MRNKVSILVISICAILILTLAFSTDSFARKKRIIFGGGPSGGTFQVVANGIQVYKPVKAVEEFSTNIRGFYRKFEKNERRQAADERGVCRGSLQRKRGNADR